MTENVKHKTNRAKWLLVFSQSRHYGGVYSGEHLPSYRWKWPTKDTWLQKRLAEVRERERDEQGK